MDANSPLVQSERAAAVEDPGEPQREIFPLDGLTAISPTDDTGAGKVHPPDFVCPSDEVGDHASDKEKLLLVYLELTTLECVPFPFNPDTCVQIVKSAALRIMEERALLMPHHEIAIFVNGYELCEYSRTLLSYHITDGAELRILQRPTGGRQVEGLPEEMTVCELQSLCLKQHSELAQLRDQQEHLCMIMCKMTDQLREVKNQLDVASSGV